MHHAGLDHRGRPHRRNRFSRPRQTIATHEQRGAPPAIAQLSEHSVSELRAFALLYPDAQDPV